VLKVNIYFDRHFAWLKYFTYHLIPVLAPNYKQLIMSPAKVRKVCYSVAELSSDLFIWIYLDGGMIFMKHFKGGRKVSEFGNLWSM
jgi:hypothetical protein